MSEHSPILPRKYRRPTKLWRLVSLGFPTAAVVLAFIYLFNYRPFGIMVVDVTYLYLLLAAFLPLCFLWTPISSKASKDRVPWYDAVLMLLSVITPVYFVTQEYNLLQAGWSMGAPTIPLIFSVILWILMIWKYFQSLKEPGIITLE